MKESASPPRTPNTNSHSPNDLKSHSPTAPSSSDESHLLSSQHLTAPTFVLPQSDANLSGGKSQLDIEFPKLTPPKTKVGWNSSSPTLSGGRNNRKSVSSDTSSNNNSLCEDTNESHEKIVPYQSQAQMKLGSQAISISTCTSVSHQALSPQSERKQQSYSFENECEKSSLESYNPNDERVIISPSRSQCKSPNYSSGENTSNNNNNNNNMSSNNNGNNGSLRSIGNHPLNMKGKPFLKNMGSSSSCEGGNTSSGFISRDSSSEQFLDQNGIDLVQFFKETLNKNAKDRNMLMKIERELLQLAVDQT
jgi:a component of the cytoplasm (encore)